MGIPIVFYTDHGLPEKDIYRGFGDLGIGNVNSGRLLEEIKGGAGQFPNSDWVLYQNGSQENRSTSSEETDAEAGVDSGG